MLQLEGKGGRNTYCHDGFGYNYLENKGYYLCNRAGSIPCHVKAFKNEEGVITLSGIHVHLRNDTLVDEINMKNEMKKRARDSDDKLIDIFNAVCQE